MSNFMFIAAVVPEMHSVLKQKFYLMLFVQGMA